MESFQKLITCIRKLELSKSRTFSYREFYLNDVSEFDINKTSAFDFYINQLDSLVKQFGEELREYSKSKNSTPELLSDFRNSLILIRDDIYSSEELQKLLFEERHLVPPLKLLTDTMPKEPQYRDAYCKEEENIMYRVLVGRNYLIEKLNDSISLCDNYLQVIQIREIDLETEENYKLQFNLNAEQLSYFFGVLSREKVGNEKLLPHKYASHLHSKISNLCGSIKTDNPAVNTFRKNFKTPGDIKVMQFITELFRSLHGRAVKELIARRHNLKN